MAFSMPKQMNNAMPKAVASTFANSSASNPLTGMPHGKPLQKGRGGVKIAVKNPFQGAINKQALVTRKY